MKINAVIPFFKDLSILRSTASTPHFFFSEKVDEIFTSGKVFRYMFAYKILIVNLFCLPK